MSLVKTNSRKTDLDYIEAILQCGSFSGGADLLLISQSAISQHIAKVEKRLGAQLFCRNIKPVKLTEDGKFFVDIERKIRSLKCQRDQYFEDLKGLKKGKIRIGSNPCRTATILAKTLRDFMNQYPGVVIDLVEVESKDIGELLREGSVDFCLTLSSRIMPTMESRVVSRERVFLAVPASCSKATLGGRPSKPSDNTPQTHFLEFKNEPFVLVNHGMKFNELYFSLCQKYGVEPKVILQSESINIVHDVVSHGLGCSLVPEELAYCTCTAECRPYYFDLSEELPENPVVVAWSKERYLSKASQIFINNLIKDTKDYSGCTSCSN